MVTLVTVTCLATAKLLSHFFIAIILIVGLRGSELLSKSPLITSAYSLSSFYQGLLPHQRECIGNDILLV